MSRRDPLALLLSLTLLLPVAAGVEASDLLDGDPVPRGAVLFDDLVPPSLTVLRALEDPPQLVEIRYRRSVVPIWGYRVAVLLDNGPWCRGQWQRGISDGGLSIVNVEWIAEDRVRDVYSILSRSLETRLPNASPTALIAPADPALQALRENLIVTGWGGRDEAKDAGRFLAAFRREDQLAGLLHEVQHAFYGFGEAPRRLPQWENEERSHLTALRHASCPHQVWHGILGQYRRGRGIYYQAVKDILEGYVARLARRPDEFPALDPRLSLMGQLYKLTPDQMRRLAGEVMRARWPEWDRAKGLQLDYRAPPPLRDGPELALRAPPAGDSGGSVPPEARALVSMSIASGELRADGIRPFGTLASRQTTWGRTHWRLAGDAVVGGLFRAPEDVKRARLRVVHMATRDGQGRGGRTFVTIRIDDRVVASGHAPPEEDVNPLERPEVFDVTGHIRPGALHRIGFALDPGRSSELVYWLERFTLELE